MAAGIPYFTLPPIELGILTLQPFGILVAVGVLFGAYLANRRAERVGQDLEQLRRMTGWAVIGGFIGAHVFDVLAYQADELREDPLLLFKVWKGISSYGGFIGGTAAALFYLKREKLPVSSYADTLTWGLVPGFTIGRLACAIVHDHIGAPTDDFFLATYYSAEVIREHHYGIEPGLHHNLGLYEFLFMLGVCGIMVLADRRPHKPGFLVAVVIALYAPVRFFLEFLRVNPEADPRYAGLTFAQWMSIAMTLLALYLIARLRGAPSPVATATAARTPEPARDAPASTSAPRAGARSGQAGKRKKK